MEKAQAWTGWWGVERERWRQPQTEEEQERKRKRAKHDLKVL